MAGLQVCSIGHASALMDWHLHREQFKPWDSLGAATEFDTALRERFPEYATD